MTATASITLHPVPARGIVVREQIAAVGIALRKERNTFLGVLAAFAVLCIWSAFRARTEFHQASIDYAPGATVPMTLIALLIPFGVWRSEDRARRAYHWTMPVARAEHTLTKVFAGWLWLMGGVALYLVTLAVLGVVMRAISGASPQHVADAWEWLVPFTSATIAYLLTSIAIVGSAHAWRWIGGVIVGYFITLLVLDVLDLRDAKHAVGLIVDGTYGLAAAIFGQVNTVHIGHRYFVGDPVRWLAVTLLWSALTGASMWLAARRHADD